MPYPRSNKEIQDSAFTMRSGNTTPFKEMGSSPVKQGMPKNFNIVGDPSTTPRFSSTKIGEAADVSLTGAEGYSAKPWEKTKKSVSKSKGILNKIGKHVPKVLKMGGKTLSKAFLPAAIAEFGIGAYTSGQKHSGGKVNPNQKSIWKNKKSIFKQ
jgi:hypothetical protein